MIIHPSDIMLRANHAPDDRARSESDPDETILGTRIDDLRSRLLNLSKSNKLLATRFAARTRAHVRIVDSSVESIYAAIATNTLRFVPLPPFEADPADERTPTFQAAVEKAMASDAEYLDGIAAIDADGDDDAPDKQEKALRALKDRVRTKLGMRPRASAADTTLVQHAQINGINPSYDLTDQSRDCDGKARLLLVPDHFERTLSRIHHSWRGELQETGISTLFIVFGFLEWRDGDADSKSLHAPLLLIPASLERVAVHGTYHYDLSAEIDEAQRNVTLSELLRTEHSIELPEPNAAENPTVYWREVEAAVRERRPSWRVRPWVAVGVWPFARMAMYHDLDRTAWPIVERTLVRELFNGHKPGNTGNSGEPEDYDVESPELEKSVPDVILDADSSQHSAIIDALGAGSLALRGPPGTGKSQTITNIIAASLSRGDTVLFVAEKMAALDVVQKRLHAAGLGNYCLELHSQATRKSVAESFKSRLEAEIPPAPMHIDQQRQELRERRQRLNEYVNLLNNPFGRTRMSVQEILWAAVRQEETHSLPQPLWSWSPTKSPKAITQVGLESGVDRVKTMIDGYLRCTGGGLSLLAHPWRGTRKLALTPFERDRAHQLVTAWLNDVRELISTVGHLRTEDAVAAADTLKGAIALVTNLQHVAKIRARFPAHLLAGAQDASTQDRLEGLATAVENRDRIRNAFKPTNVAKLDPVVMRSLAAQASILRLDDARPAEVSELASRATERATSEQLRANIIMSLGVKIGRTSIAGRDVPYLLSLASALDEISNEALRYRVETLAAPPASRLLGEASKRRQSLQQVSSELRDVVDLDLSRETASILFDEILILQSSGPFSFMSSKFRIARAHALRLTRNAQKKKPRELADILERARLHIAAEAALAADSRLAQICGAHHDGIDTEFELLQKAADYYAKVDQIVGTDVEARRFLTDAPIAELRDFQAKVEEIRLHVAAYAGDSRTIADRLTAYQTIADNFALLSSAISNAHGCIPLSVRFSQFAQLGDNVAAYQFRATEADQLLSDLTAAIDTSELPSQPDQLRRLAADGRIIAKMPDWLRASAISADFAPDIEFAAARRTKDAWDVALKAFETLASFVSIDKKSFFDATPIDAIPTKEFERRASLCHQDRDNLVGWTEWLKSRESANEAGVRDFVDMALESGLPLNQIPDFYITAIRRAQADAVFNEHPKLKSFRGSNQEQARREFQILDRRIQSLGRRHIASKIHTRRPPEGISTGLVRNYTDLSLVKHEAYKTKKHAPIRQIFDRAFAAATALKPCVLASPLAVAQHLPRTNHRFDLLVIDEASQMRPEDAVGALARCGRAVIVGDQKQLPPSNFFLKSSIHEGEDDDNAELVVDEAILDRALAVFPSRGLRWHYRSRHPSLISYSNRTFYGDRLIVFPAADKDHPNLGVRLERVSGTFRNSVNVEEANAVVAAAVTHMKTRTTESLAVVTMNQPQRDFIQSEFDRLAVTDADIETYLRLWTEEREGLEPFIIKNLENIQGDERDVVLISCVYGPAELGGKVMQRFGPINGAAGDRRLNVLFSRAKCQVRVFASLSADHILADSGKAGLRVFREYLAYAATGNLDSSAESTGEPESPFEESVLAELRRCGFDGVPQVGVSGYFIDIGVRHRDWPWGFIMGIECDGASYHSSRSARDRDRLRQEVLEGLGWQLHRIWSTDWFHDHTTERNRLADALRRRMTELAPEAERRHKVLKEADKQAGQARRQAQAPATATNQSVQANLFTLPTAAAPPKPDAQTPPLANAIAISEMAAAAPSERASPERGIRVGDIVTYAFAREPNRPITITITENRYDPDNGFLSKNHPTVKQLLGYGEGSEIELSVANGVRYIRILEVLHSPADDA